MPLSEIDMGSQFKPPVRTSPPAVIAEVVHDPPLAPNDPPHGPAARYYTPSPSFHWTVGAIAVVVVVASMVLSVRNQEQVIVPIVDKALPGTCTFRNMTGHPCPGCGLTRSFISMGHAQLEEAWNYNPAGLLFFVVVVFQIPYRLFQLNRIRHGKPEHRFARFDRWILVFLVVALLLQWACAFAVSFT